MEGDVIIEVRSGSKARRTKFRSDAAMQGLRIGRGPSCDIVLDDHTVAEFHALLKPISNHWVLYWAQAGAVPAGSTEHRVDRTAFEIGPFSIRVV
jgi:pSer/pThr/pTyr-binding forkhead associated (FHA) protein